MTDRVQHALDTLGLTLTRTPGRYGRYLQFLDNLLHHGGARAASWTARDIDTALYGPAAPATRPSQQHRKPAHTRRPAGPDRAASR